MNKPSDVTLVAQAFLERYGLDCLDEMDRLAPRLGLVIKEVPAQGFEGALLRIKGCSAGTILLSRSVEDVGRYRFTLAHEVGHYVLPNHGQEGGYCRGKQLDRWGKGLSRFEREANEFAAEILMPTERVRDLLDEEPSYVTAAMISKRCTSSLSASSYRLAELTSHRFAIVWSEEGQVKWSKGSAEFDAEFQVRRDACSQPTFASRCFANQPIPDEYDLVSASSWLYGSGLREGAEILEHSRHLPMYRAVITFLLVQGLVEQHSRYGDEWGP